jgi:hypothetical protein
MTRGSVSFVQTVLLAVLATGCLILGPDALTLSAVAERDVATADEPARIRVTARNNGYDRVQWGHGSSTCQLHIAIREDTTWHRAMGGRFCTGDYAPHVLEPGHSRTEHIDWNGAVLRETGFVRLPPGRYEVRAAAGLAPLSPPVTINVQ